MVSAQQATTNYLADMDDEQLACRAGRHSWPILIPGRKIPRGIRATLNAHDGSYQITETCPVCGETRTKTTLPRGVYDRNAVYRYEYPPNWIRIPLDEPISRADIVAELYRRVGSQLFKLAQVAQ